MPALRFYFHTETALNDPPAPPAGSLTMSEVLPDQVDANAASIAGGHQSTTTGVAASQLNKPTTKDNTTNAGSTPPTATPLSASFQFGWFSDKRYNGAFDPGTWTIVWREDDNGAGITGHEVVNIYANKTRDFSGQMRFLTQLVSGSDWWQGTVNAASWTQANVPILQVSNEFLFFQVWCGETAGFSAGNTLTIHQEGSDLNDATRANILTPNFTPAILPEAFKTFKAYNGCSVSGS